MGSKMCLSHLSSRQKESRVTSMLRHMLIHRMEFTTMSIPERNWGTMTQPFISLLPATSHVETNTSKDVTRTGVQNSGSSWSWTVQEVNLWSPQPQPTHPPLPPPSQPLPAPNNPPPPAQTLMTGAPGGLRMGGVRGHLNGWVITVR